MFGFRSRKKFNTAVDRSLNKDYQLATRDNPRFPGAGAYLELIDNAWRGGMTPEEGALYIAVLQYCGLMDHSHSDNARELLDSIYCVAPREIHAGKVSAERWAKFEGAIKSKRN